MRILITGGAGYIGTHVAVATLAAGHDVHVIDSFVNASPVALERVREIAGRDFGVTEADLRDRAAVEAAIATFAPEVTIHLAGLKAVGESVATPLAYYDANVAGALVLLETLAAAGARRLVFSSSATVYGDPERVPIDETHPRRATNPYGRTKLVIETILEDLVASDPAWSVALLRYFNPVGAHPSGRIGEDPRGVPNNLMPFVAQVAVGRRPEVRVFGDDYATPDGTGVRDYIHVVDLAEAHVAAVDWTAEAGRGAEAFNIGLGRGTSVLEIVAAFARAAGRPIPHVIAPRRPGDIATCYADPAKALATLAWRPTRDLDAMCESAWSWQSQNPNGFDT
jgi:UDP-glucose 4-epimerase